jgi:hypothetical protein
MPQDTSTRSRAFGSWGPFSTFCPAALKPFRRPCHYGWNGISKLGYKTENFKAKTPHCNMQAHGILKLIRNVLIARTWFYSANYPLELFSDRLHRVIYLLSLDYLLLQQLSGYYFSNYVYPIPPCQPSLWEETRAPEENGLSAECWQTLFTWVDKKGASSDHCATAKKIRRMRVVGKLFGPRYNELNGASLKDLLFALLFALFWFS